MYLVKKHKIHFRPDYFGFKDSILDFIKETDPKCEKCLVEKYC